MDTLPTEYPFLTGLVSFVLLVVASWCVGEGGEVLGKKYDASIIGGLLIAWLNTTPETIFFIAALQSDNPRFAVGAVSGSTIVVCTIALGAILFIGSNARKQQGFKLQANVKHQATILGISVVLPGLLALYGFWYLLAIAGALSYLSFIIYTIAFKKDEAHHPKKTDLEASPMTHGTSDNEADSDDEEEDVSVWKGFGYLFVGGSLIFAFSEPFITSVVTISNKWSVNPILLAFFLAPVASEMPEILESISLSRKGKVQSINIAFSNLVGGTISKTTLLCGILSYFGITKGFAWEAPNYTISMCLIVMCAGAAGLIGSVFTTQNARHGYILWTLFAITGFIQYYYNSTFEGAFPVPVEEAVY